MRLTVIGCSGSVPGPSSAASCYLIEADGFALVLDLGNGALGPLQRHVDLAAIGTVLLSHLHPDHCADVCSLAVALEYGLFAPADPIPVLGPAGLGDRLVELHGGSGTARTDGLWSRFAVGGVGPVTWPIGPFEVTARRVLHPVEAYAYRLEHGGRVLAYSGDCAPCTGLDEVARAADLALVEAGYVEPGAGAAGNAPGVHHTGREAGALAARVGVGRLLVTHVPPWHDPESAAAAARTAFAGAVEVARPGAVYEV